MSVTIERIDWGDGLVGQAVRASESRRLRRFVQDEESEPIALFDPRHHVDSGDWYGEHAGKWLCAAVLAWKRTGDERFRERIERVSRFLAQMQEADGYLGTYTAGASCRFTSKEATGVRTWDLWVHGWTMLGMMAAGRLDEARRIGERILATFPAIHSSVLDLGNHSGLSSMVIVHPMAELGIATADPRFLQFGLDTIDQGAKRGLDFAGAKDVADIGTGKIYQILWVLLGILSLHRATGDPKLLGMVERLWTNIEAEHLTPLGGPWGGIATHKEVFDAPGFFSPYGMVETCSATTWLVLSRELFAATGKLRYVEAVERTLMNTILGALNPNGEDWCYFTFPNGRRNDTYHWACCKSSGALALEESASAALTPYREGIAVNLYEPFRADLRIDGCEASITFAEGGLTVEAPETVRIPVYLRQPAWASGPIVAGLATPQDDRFLWIAEAHDRLQLDLSASIQVHAKAHSVDHHGQEIVRMDYACVSKGPYVYAARLIDGYKKEETLRLPRLNPESVFRETGPRSIDLKLPAREPIPFAPYCEQGDWRTTWLQVAWQ